MPPQLTQPTSTAGSLDQDAVNLAKAIRQTESGGNFQAKGKSGEFGAYQFTPATWASSSKKYLGQDVQLEQATPEQQNEVAYKQIKEWKDKGFNVGQVASMWNAGEKNPDAYQQNFKGVNKMGVRYDVPAYAKSVAEAYQTLKSGGSVGVDPKNPSSIAAPNTNREGLLASIFRGITQPVVTTLARPVQAVARIAGASPEAINEASSKVPFYGERGLLNVPETFKDVIKDVGRAAETVSLGLPVKGILGATKVGALMGAGSGLENDPSVGGALKGAAGGAALGAAGGAIAKVLSGIPTRLTEAAFPKMNPAQIERTLATKSMGSKVKLLQQSDDAIKGLGTQLGNLLDDVSKRVPGTKDIITGKEILQMAAQDERTKQALLDTGLHYDEIAKKFASLVPEKAALINKLFDKGLTLKELHRLNSGLGSKVFKSVFDEPAVRAGKELGNILYHGSSDIIKTLVPDSAPLFEELTKEYGINTILTKLAKKPSAGGLIKWKDIIPFLTGNAFGGPISGFALSGANRVAGNPALLFGAAKVAQTASRAAAPVLGRSGLLSPVTHASR